VLEETGSATDLGRARGLHRAARQLASILVLLAVREIRELPARP
jgi:hypothetical protein